MNELKQKQKGVVRPDLLALRLFPRTIGLKGLSLIVRKNSCHTRSPRYRTIKLIRHGTPIGPRLWKAKQTVSALCQLPLPPRCGSGVTPSELASVIRMALLRPIFNVNFSWSEAQIYPNSNRGRQAYAYDRNTFLYIWNIYASSTFWLWLNIKSTYALAESKVLVWGIYFPSRHKYNRLEEISPNLHSIVKWRDREHFGRNGLSIKIFQKKLIFKCVIFKKFQLFRNRKKITWTNHLHFSERNVIQSTSHIFCFLLTRKHIF